jgi:hypothetical protein
MSLQLYTVTLTDLGEYTATVAADTPAEAESIARTILQDEAMSFPVGLVVVKRETQAAAVVAALQPENRYNVRATYSLDFCIDKVPGFNNYEAEIHAKRIYDESCGPFEFEHCGDNVGTFRAREVVS